jgi:antitoxin MazE
VEAKASGHYEEFGSVLDIDENSTYNVITSKDKKEIVMGSGVKTRIVKIGNSRGIRIPKVLLEQAKLGDEIEMEVQGDKLIVHSVKRPRQGWDEQFAEMALRGDDKYSSSEVISSSNWDKDEWEW